MQQGLTGLDRLSIFGLPPYLLRALSGSAGTALGHVDMGLVTFSLGQVPDLTGDFWFRV